MGVAYRGLLFWGFCTLSMLEIRGQATSSPYTIGGIGEVRGIPSAYHAGMGGAGVALHHERQIQGLNPATLSYYNLTLIQLGMVSDARVLRQQSHASRSGFTNFGGLQVVLPLLAKRWGAGIGILPYSHVRYSIRFRENVLGTSGEAIHQLQGRGGVNMFYMEHGVRLFKGLSVGVQGRYLFGYTAKEDLVNLEGDTNDPEIARLQTSRSEYTDYQGWGLSLGLHYRTTWQNETHALSIGMVGAPSFSLRAKEALRVRRRDLLTGVLIGPESEMPIRAFDYALPWRWKSGIAYQNENRWRIALDVEGEVYTPTPRQKRQSITLRIGTEYTPNAAAFSYLLRLPYRMSFSWSQLPFTDARGRQINDFSLYIGNSFIFKSGSRIDLGLRGGTRGVNAAGVTQEEYLQLYIHTTFTSKWFTRRVYE